MVDGTNCVRTNTPEVKTVSLHHRYRITGKLWGWCALADRHLNISEHVPDTSNRILEYHSVGGSGFSSISIDRLRRDLQHVIDRYEIVDLPAVVNDGDEQKKVALTFDDGYADFYGNVLPILESFDVPATVFVIGATLEDPEFAHDEGQVYDYMTESQLLELADHDLVTVGNHTMRHPRLPEVDERADVESEIVDAKNLLQKRLGVPVNRFCYPYNLPSVQAIEVVRRAHDYGVTGHGDRNLLTPRTDPVVLPRVPGVTSPERCYWELTDAGAGLKASVKRFV